MTAICMTMLTLRAPDAAECTAVSGPQRVAVLELYTSEGCDSCPPADRWVSELPAKKFTSERVLPLAFHVDYWNQLGWVDPYSQALFSARQQQQSKRRGVSFVVTPQLLLNGQDYRRGALSDDFADRIRTVNEARPQADIRLKLSRNGSALTGAVEVSVATDMRRAQVYLALYEMNLVTAVGAGENRGKTLRHDFVVRTLAGPLDFDDNGRLNRVQRFELDPRWKTQDVNVAVFVQHPQTGDILQALSARCS